MLTGSRIPVDMQQGNGIPGKIPRMAIGMKPYFYSGGGGVVIDLLI